MGRRRVYPSPPPLPDPRSGVGGRPPPGGLQHAEGVQGQERVTRARRTRERLISRLGRLAEPRYAGITVAAAAILFAIAVHQSRNRHVGDLLPGSPELHQDSRYNVDARAVMERFSFGLDVLTVIAEGKPEACLDFDVMEALARFSWRMQNVPGAVNVISLPLVARLSNAGWTEGNLKWMDLPRNSSSLVRVAGLVPEQTGLVNVDCSVMPIYVFMADHKAKTIEGATVPAESGYTLAFALIPANTIDETVARKPIALLIAMMAAFAPA